MELNYNNTLPRSVTLLWGPPPAEHQNGNIVGYRIEFITLSPHNSTQFFTVSTSLDVALLDPFTSYSFSVTAATAVGFGPESEHAELQTAEDGEL